MEIINHTNPGQTPVDGDWIETKDGQSSIKRQYHDAYVETAEEVAEDARSWRNVELSETDWVVPVSDHPQRADYITYRQALRNWPATDNFPATPPEL